jgi:hypothetical protein
MFHQSHLQLLLGVATTVYFAWLEAHAPIHSHAEAATLRAEGHLAVRLQTASSCSFGIAANARPFHLHTHTHNTHTHNTHTHTLRPFTWPAALPAYVLMAGDAPLARTCTHNTLRPRVLMAGDAHLGAGGPLLHQRRRAGCPVLHDARLSGEQQRLCPSAAAIFSSGE